MRQSLLLLPLACLVGCMADTDRPATASPAAPAKPAAPAVAAPTSVPAPAAVAPTVAAPAPAPVAVVAPPEVKPVTLDLAKFTGPTESAANFGYDESAGRIFFYSNGEVVLPVKLAADGDYELAISGACDEANGQKAKFTVAVDGQAVGGEITCTVVEPKEYAVKVAGLKAGDHKIAIAFINDIYKENEYDLNFFVHGVIVRPAK